jgi:hypothetical protein
MASVTAATVPATLPWMLATTLRSVEGRAGVRFRADRDAAARADDLRRAAVVFLAPARLRVAGPFLDEAVRLVTAARFFVEAGRFVLPADLPALERAGAGARRADFFTDRLRCCRFATPASSVGRCA